MSTQELQLSLIQKILQTVDEDKLSLLQDFLLSISQKTQKNISNPNPILTRPATKKEAEAIEEGLASGFLSREETKDFLEEIGYK